MRPKRVPTGPLGRPAPNHCPDFPTHSSHSRCRQSARSQRPARAGRMIKPDGYRTFLLIERGCAREALKREWASFDDLPPAQRHRRPTTRRGGWLRAGNLSPGVLHVALGQNPRRAPRRSRRKAQVRLRTPLSWQRAPNSLRNSSEGMHPAGNMRAFRQCKIDLAQ